MDGQREYSALSGDAYDSQWERLADFIIHNPGARHRRRNTAQMLRDLKPSTILDVGCGTGDLMLLMRDTFAARGHADMSWLGVDIAVETILGLQRDIPWADFKLFDVVQDEMDQQFDLVTCCEVIEHLDDAEAALKNLGKLVKPGGYLFISCPTGKIYQTERSIGHIYHPKPCDLRRWGAQAGLQTERELRWGWPMYRTLKNITNISSDYSVKHFGSGNYSPFKVLVNKIAYFVTFPSVSSPWACQLFWLFRKPMQS